MTTLRWSSDSMANLTSVALCLEKFLEAAPNAIQRRSNQLAVDICSHAIRHKSMPDR